MKALTIKPPFAYRVVEGMKDVENRFWKTSFRGRLLIHNGRRPAEYVWQIPRLARAMGVMINGTPDAGENAGCVIGSVEVHDCIPSSDCELYWADDHDGYCWLLRDPRMFWHPLPWRGQPGLFEIPDEQVSDGIVEPMVPSRYWQRLQRESLDRTGVPKGMRD